MFRREMPCEGLVMLWHRARARAGARAVSEGDAL